MAARRFEAESRSWTVVWPVVLIVVLLGTAHQVFGIPWPMGPQGSAHAINKTYGDWNGYRCYIDSVTVPGQYITRIAYHTAVDIPADSGTAVLAVFDGYVAAVESLPATVAYLSYISIARTVGGNPAWHYGHVMRRRPFHQVNTPVSFGDTLGFVAPFTPNLANCHLHFYLEEQVGNLTESVCNPLDSLVPAPNQEVTFFARYMGRHKYKIDYVEDRVETVDTTRTLWDVGKQEYLLRDSVDIVSAVVTEVAGNGDPGIYGIGYGIAPVDTGGSRPYRSMLVMRGSFQVADSLAYYLTFVDTLASQFDWPLCRYIVTNCGNSTPNPTKGISNVQENCWPTRVDTSGTGTAQRNAEAKYPDGWYDVFLKAWSHPGDPDTAAVHDTVYVDNFGGYAKRVAAKLHTGSRDTTTFYEAYWENGELVIDTQAPCRPLQGDTVFVEVTFSESMDDTIQAALEGAGPLSSIPLQTVRWDTVSYPRDYWVGRVPMTTWESIRNMAAGERRLVIWAEDAVSRKALDSNPETAAYWDGEAEEWVGFEDDNGAPSDSGGHDRVHSLYICGFRDVCLAVDASSSQNLDGWELSQMHVFQHLIQWMMAQADADDYRVAAWRFCNIVEQIVDYDDSLEDAWAGLFDAGPQIVGVHEPGQFNPVNPFAGYMANTDVENPLLVAAQYATAEYDDPKVVCVVSDFWHNFGNTDPIVEARYHWIAEQGPIFLLANEGALYGSECSEELKEAARISGGGYLEGYGAASVESLYKAITPVFVSRGVLAQVDGAGSDTVSVRVDSTMTRLDVIVSLSSWSGAAILREREEGKERSRGTYQLRDEGGSLVAPTYYGSGLCQWEVASPGTGAWQLEVIADPTEEYSVMARGGSPIELRLLSTGSIAEGATDTIAVKLEWEALSDSLFELIDQQGNVAATLNLAEEATRTYSCEHTFSEAGHYRVRIRGDLGTQVVERETELCLNVRAAPTIELISPASGETETAGTSYTIEWIDLCPERNASVTIGYDEDDVYSGTEEIIATVEEAGADTGRVVWEVFSAPEGTWFVWACIDDSLNSPQRVYGGRVTVTKGYQEGIWPVDLGAQIEKNLCLSDLDNNGTVETIVVTKDSLVYVLNYDGTNHGVNWPFNCHGMLTSGAAVGDVDGDNEKEVVLACSDTALVWVLSADGTVESGWPQQMRSGTWSAPLLVDLAGEDGVLEIVAVGYDSTLWAWDGFGSPLGGNWPVTLAHINQNSSPAGGDIDQDGENEVVVSSRYGSSGAKVYAIETDGSIKWEYEVDYPVWTSPAIADVDRDGKVEVVFTTFGFLTNTSRLFVLNGEDGSEADGWTGGQRIDQWAESSPAVGDLDQSGSLGIVIADGTGEVEAWNGSGTQLWHKIVSDYAVKSDPLILDLTGDRSMECVVGANHRVYTLNAVTGDTISAYSRSTESDTRSVAVADLDGDGDLELVATVFSGVVYAWDLPGSTWADGQEWPQLQRDEAKTGEYRESAPPTNPELLEAEFVSPDSMRVTWRTVNEDVYGRDELVKKYVIYRDGEPYGVDGSTLAGEVQAPDTSFTEQSAAVGDPNTSVFYRVKAEDMYENQSALSDSTVGEVDFGLGGPGKRRDREKLRQPLER